MSEIQRVVAAFESVGLWVEEGLSEVASFCAYLGERAHPWGTVAASAVLLFAAVETGAWKLLLLAGGLMALGLALPLAVLIALSLIGHTIGFVLHVADETRESLGRDEGSEAT